jgi:hypothetical protein
LAVVTPSSKESDFKSTFVFIACLPYNSEPSYVHTMFDSEDKVAEIYSYGGEQAWVEFETPEHAAVAVANYDQYPFGPNSQKVFVDLVPREQVPKADSALLRYTDFVRQRDAEIKSSTVFVSNLPNSNPIKNVNQMIEKIGLDGTYNTMRKRMGMRSYTASKTCASIRMRKAFLCAFTLPETPHIPDTATTAITGKTTRSTYNIGLTPR